MIPRINVGKGQVRPMGDPLSKYPIRVSAQGNAYCIELLDAHVTGEAWVEEIRKAVNKVMQKQPATPRIIVNLAKVEHLSSAILGEFIGISRQLLRSDGRLRFTGVKPEVAEIFAITRLDQTLHIDPDMKTSLQNMA